MLSTEENESFGSGIYVSGDPHVIIIVNSPALPPS